MNITQNTNRVIEFMSNTETLRYTGALAGFAWSYGTPLFLLEYPFSSVFRGAIGAAISVFCAEFVDGFLQPKMRPVLVGTLMASTVYYTYRSCSTGRHHSQSCADNHQQHGNADEYRPVVNYPAPPKYDA